MYLCIFIIIIEDMRTKKALTAFLVKIANI